MPDTRGFGCWDAFWGQLPVTSDTAFPSTLYGFENLSSANRKRWQAKLPDCGGCYGFVETGSLCFEDSTVSWRIGAGQWFSTAAGGSVSLAPNTRVVIAQRIGFRGLYANGGPVEASGRLRYIDGCSDTLLAAPPVLGDPCLNLLHFPPRISQTPHTHPSLRAGIVASGAGVCITEKAEVGLRPGLIFSIPAATRHAFKTGDTHLNVIAFHPDSDWGPTHEDHPMLNRTWVDGEKIDNSSNEHRSSDLIRGSHPP